jgi:hypothetical protein
MGAERAGKGTDRRLSIQGFLAQRADIFGGTASGRHEEHPEAVPKSLIPAHGERSSRCARQQPVQFPAVSVQQFVTTVPANWRLRRDDEVFRREKELYMFEWVRVPTIPDEQGRESW